MRLNALVLVIGRWTADRVCEPAGSTNLGDQGVEPADRGRFDAQLNEVIEQVEIKYGYRTGRQGQPGSTVKSEPAVDPEMIKEIESYYEQKKLRDLSREPQRNCA